MYHTPRVCTHIVDISINLLGKTVYTTRNQLSQWIPYSLDKQLSRAVIMKT
jgi:hypothetical protein